MAPAARRKLTRAEWIELDTFSKEAGRFWRDVLLQLWKMGKASDLLQPLRDEKKFGESWLRGFSLSNPNTVEGETLTLRRDPLYNRYLRAADVTDKPDVGLEAIARELLLAIGDVRHNTADDPAVIVLAREICWHIRPDEGNRYEAALRICLEKANGKDRQPTHK